MWKRSTVFIAAFSGFVTSLRKYQVKKSGFGGEEGSEKPSLSKSGKGFASMASLREANG